ncbi:Imm52 family immunity protein [Photorhabdus aegyptia]|uniref:Imm52 family immunity protein n=1 Tax=Photorhabdus aegyptia TaxID=2805098 RepID=UPI001E4BECA6|nr:Imm52 family immunity protein [Photorhabdus aegyptia]MCC8459315.1 immunity 52 family protein [Photorhabdus aegyptia]
MAILSPEIELYFDRQEPLTPEIVLVDLYRITQQIDHFFGRHKTWFLTGHTRKEALEHPVFEGQHPTKKAVQVFEKNYKENFPFMGKSIWDGENDDLACSLFYENYRSDRLGQTNITIRLNINEKDFQFSRLIDFITFLVLSRNAPYIMVETNGYTLKQNQVFPDRLSAGWMIYLPFVIDPTLLPMADEILPITNDKEQLGTLMITKQGIFDGENQDDIDKANDIEIQLLNLGLLPLITEV